MRKWFFILVLLSIFHLHSAPVQGWGYSVHEEIGIRAVEKIPGNWKIFLQAHFKDLREATIFPDENKGNDPAEGPRHYDDSDVPHQDINVSSTSQNYSLGVVSWAALNTSSKLVDAILEQNGNEVIFQMGVLSHYLADASQPFHATENFDGQKTGNNGIHSRFETLLPSKYWNDLWVDVKINEPEYISDVYNATEGAIESGLALVPTTLAADDQASESSDYWGTFYNLTREIMVERLTLAVQLTLNAWYSAIVTANAIDEDPSNFSYSTQKASSSVDLTSSQNQTNLSWIMGLAGLFALKTRRKRY